MSDLPSCIALLLCVTGRVDFHMCVCVCVCAVQTLKYSVFYVYLCSCMCVMCT